MAERVQPKPTPEIIQDEAITRSLNLSVLRRLDPLIEEILIKTPPVALYQMDSKNAQWGKRDVKGCLWVVRRDSASRFQFIVLNSLNPGDPGNFVEDILEIHDYDVKRPFLMYLNKDKLVRGILFKEPQVCQDVCSVLNRILIAFGKTFPNLKLSPTKRTPDSSIFAPLHRPCFLIPNLDPSQSKNSTNATTVSVEEVREVLKRLVENESFVKIVHSEILRVRSL